MGDFSHLKNKKGEMIAKPLPQPTLPNLSVDDDIDDDSSMHTRGPPPSTYTQDYYYSDKATVSDYPPMPAYNQPYSAHQPPGAYAHFNPSQASFPADDAYYQQHIYDEDNDSTMHLPAAAAPFAQQSERPASALPNPYGSLSTTNSYLADPHDVYQGKAVYNGEMARRSPQPPSGSGQRPSSGLAYEDSSSDHSGPAPVGPPQQSSPYGGYSGYPTSQRTHGQQQWHGGGGRGRSYDEESNGGYSHAM